jgi:hypothetical protein
MQSGLRWEFFHKLVNMEKYVIDVRAHCRLWLKHPGNKFVKCIRVRTWYNWPLYLRVHNGQLQASSRFTKSVLKGRNTIPVKNKMWTSVFYWGITGYPPSWYVDFIHHFSKTKIVWLHFEELQKICLLTASTELSYLQAVKDQMHEAWLIITFIFN